MSDMITQREHGIEQNMRERMAFYLAGLGACAMGLASLKTIVSQGGFVLIAFVLLVGGFGLSWAARAGLIARTKLDAGMLVVLLSALAAVLIVPEFRNRLLPPEVLNATDLTMAVVLAWLMVACSYGLTADVRVLFLCVPSLSLIGLTATFDPNAEVMSYFGAFLALTCFVLIRENVFLHREQVQGGEGSLRLSSDSMKMHIGVTASVTLTALVVGITLGTLLYPLLVKALSRGMGPFDAAQLVEQSTGEEFVPVAAGPADLSNQEMMTVRCEEALLWRGPTFNKYTGRGWASDLLPDQQMWIQPSEERSHTPVFRLPKHPLYGANPAVKRVKQAFRITSGFYHTVFGAAEPEVVAFNLPEPVLRLGNRIEAMSPYGRNGSYTVISRVSTATPKQLSNAPRTYPKVIRERYLAVPETCWQVQKLARRIVGKGANPYAKALAIQGFLEERYVYDAKTPPSPEPQDPVTHFLFQSKRGYCDIFASAMVIMAREVGIPARWVTGFASGEYNSADGLYHVLAKDRHAWAELYFPGYGWIAFDATPASEGRVGLLTRIRDFLALIASDRPTALAGGVILLLVAYLIKTEVVDRLRKRKRFDDASGYSAAEIARVYRRMCEFMARAGYPRPPSATPWEYAFEVDRLFRHDLEHVSSAVDTVTADFVEFRYSVREAPPERILAMSSAVGSLIRHVRHAGRRRLLPQR